MVTTRGLGQKEAIKLAMKGKNPVKLLVNGGQEVDSLDTFNGFGFLTLFLKLPLG